MAERKKTPEKTTLQDRAMLRRIRANFIAKGTSFHAFCEVNNINRGNAEKAILGSWAGKKGQALKSQIIQASKENKTTQPTEVMQ